MTLSVWLTFLVATSLFSMVPGAGMISTVSNALNGGVRRAAINLIGLQLAIIVHLSVVVIGLGALFSSSPIAFDLLKYMGAAYLGYLGIQRFLTAVTVQDEMPLASAKVNYWQLIREGFFINLMNPKSVIFLTAFLPSFLNMNMPLNTQYLILGVTVVVMDVVVMLNYAYLANICRKYLINERFLLMQNRVFGVLFILMGIFLVALKH
ncbi:lysine exporter protein LysE/YggA [Psychromonas sp. CNPT3]|uniref:LysE family transporter n=1 Tax=Psychromonas sp. CNPT3 TaxID=314282 RepID=UPI00006E80D1|nr:LysE family transporter [Psychromonas sp. CNPT3]AGH80770.1 lysine exporter protein LysE/YggA [Psychromonas sp. CNPT3]